MKPTREQLKAAIIANVEDWVLSTLIRFAQEKVSAWAEDATDDELIEECSCVCLLDENGQLY